jgi:hypothetical protein
MGIVLLFIHSHHYSRGSLILIPQKHSIYWATRLVGHVWHSGILVFVAFNGAFKFAVQGMFQHVHINYSLAKPTLKTIGFGGALYGA